MKMSDLFCHLSNENVYLYATPTPLRYRCSVLIDDFKEDGGGGGGGERAELPSGRPAQAQLDVADGRVFAIGGNAGTNGTRKGTTDI